MVECKKPRGLYRNHRENQRNAILAAAEDLFIQQGIEQVTMSGIAAACKITRATIYQYFPNKEEIAWAIFEILISRLRQKIQSDIFESHATGYEKLDRFISGAVERAAKSTRETAFMAQFNLLYARMESPVRIRQTLQREMGSHYGFMPNIIRQGIADGTLRSDLDPDLTSAAIFNFIVSLEIRMGLMGRMVEAEYNRTLSELFGEIGRIFIAGMRACPAQAQATDGLNS